MNAIDALKLANSRGATAMLHARELSIRRKQMMDKVAGMPPVALVAAGIGAGALLGKLANRHPLIASASTVVAAILRYAPADTLMRLWEQRAETGADAAMQSTTSPSASAAAHADASTSELARHATEDTPR